MSTMQVREFAGKVVLITGAASGIGAATASEFARQGASLSLIDIESMDETIQTIGTVAPIVKVLETIGDLASSSVCEDYVLRTFTEFGRIDVLVNNAGVVAADTILDTGLDTLDKVMNINFRAMFQLCALCTPYLIKSKGNIVNVSSEYSDNMNAGYLSYTISKAAVNQLSRSIAANLAPHGVRVNNILPGGVLTNLNKEYTQDFPAVKFAEPQEAANLITFLASSKAGFVTGSNVLCDGGLTLRY